MTAKERKELNAMQRRWTNMGKIFDETEDQWNRGYILAFRIAAKELRRALRGKK